MYELKPLSKTKPTTDPFLVCDIEARDWTRFLVIGVYDGDKFYYFKRMEKFFLYLFSLKRDVTVYAHFGGVYDFMFLMDAIAKIYVARHNYKYEMENIIPRGSGILSFDLTNGTNTIHFSDSSAFLPFSLDRICKTFNVEHKKLKWDHSKTVRATRKLIAYLKNDCVGLYEAIVKYRHWDLIKKSGAKSTMASQAMQVLRLFLKEPIPCLTVTDDAFVRSSYFGGRTEVFRPFYTGKSPIRCYDVNSLYPTIMRNNDFPTWPKRRTYRFYENEMGFYDVTVTVPKMHIPPLGTIADVGGKSEKFIFPTGTFRGVWTSEELKYAKSLGVSIDRVHKGILFHSGGPIFREFIDTLYEKRAEAKKKGDSVTDVLTKLLMNSTYGRFGLERIREQIVQDDGQEGIKIEYEIEVGADALVRFGKEKIKLDQTFTNVAIASWVTSLARIHMHKLYRKLGKDLYYTDTDSVFTTKKLKEGDGLGEVKLEYAAKGACFLLPKTYIINNILGKDKRQVTDLTKKVVMKGFGTRKINQFELDDFVTALEGELRVLRVEYRPRGLMRFKTAMKKGKLLMKAMDTSREIRSQYDKRTIYKRQGHYHSKPLHIPTDRPQAP